MLAGLNDGDAEPLDRQRILGAHVGEALRAADGEAGDGHGLDHAVRIAFEKAAIHECARIALVAVAEHVLHVALGLAAEIPLEAGGEAGAAAPAQTRVLDLLDHLLRRHRGQRLAQRRIAAMGEIVVDLQWIDDAAVTQGDLDLAGEERIVPDPLHRFAGLGLPPDKAFHHLVAQHRLLDDVIDVGEGDFLVENAFGLADEHRAAGARAEAPGLHDVHLGETAFGESIFEGGAEGRRSGRDAAGAGAQVDAGDIGHGDGSLSDGTRRRMAYS